MPTPRFLSPTNSFLPVPTGIVSGYVRDPKEFALNDYVQFVESPSTTGSYYVLDRDHPVRMVNPAEFDWAPGSRAPQAHTNAGKFHLNAFMLDRVAPTFELDETTVEMARKYGNWDPIAYESKAMADQAMNMRTMRVWLSGQNGLALDTPATWGSNTASAATLAQVPGGTWANSQSTAPVIQTSLFEAARRINIATNGKVKPSDLTIVINPVAAIQVAVSNEIKDFVKQQASAPDILKSGWDNPNKLWGLPADLFGFKLCVEDAARVTTASNTSGAAGSRSYIKADSSAVLLARPGGISAPFGGKSFSTVQLYWHKYDMAVEMHQPDGGWHKMWEGRVVDYRTVVSPAIESGYQIQGII